MTARITLALLFVIPAAMAYPWPSTPDRAILGVAIAAVIVLFAWWQGQFMTTTIGRRVTMWLRRGHRIRTDGALQTPESSDYTTVLLRLDPSEPIGLPLPLIASYLDRYGVHCDTVRVTSRDDGGARTTWISLTLGAADNLPALQARSSRIPLRDTAEVAVRRLADHLRETGWNVAVTDAVDALIHGTANETWRGMCDESGYVAAYRVAVDGRLANTLTKLWSHSAPEIWTALEFGGTNRNPTIAVVCAVRGDERPGAKAPLPGLSPLRGRHRPAVDALYPLSVHRLDTAPAQLPEGLLGQLWWPADGVRLAAA
jgi:type VII secretion protein EccE